MNGFLNILKPPGMSSAAVVATVKRLTGERRVGHAGTLDPEAAGILPVMVGQATRLFDYLSDKEKRYIAECAFGAETDTQDAQGIVMVTGWNYPTHSEIERAAESFIGTIWQRPGIYSAVKQNGKPLYKLARAGMEAQAPLRQVRIEQIILGPETPDHGIMLTVQCGKGTYIRSLCEDIGRACGCPAHMRFLLRTQSGAFDLSTALTLQEAEQAAADGQLTSYLLPMDYPLKHIPQLTLPKRWWQAAEHGSKIPLDGITQAEGLAEGEIFRVYLGTRFAGLALPEAKTLRWRTVMQPDTGEETDVNPANNP